MGDDVVPLPPIAAEVSDRRIDLGCPLDEEEPGVRTGPTVPVSSPLKIIR